LTLALAVGLLGLSPALAGTKDQLDAAREELEAIRADLTRATGRWQAAQQRFELTRAEAQETRGRMADLRSRIDRIERRLAERAVEAFTSGSANGMDVLLSSGSFTEFSDRLEFLGNVAQSDVDLALERDVALEELRRQEEDLVNLSERQAEAAAEMDAARDEIAADFAEVQDRVTELTRKWNQELAAARALLVIGQTPSPNGSLNVCPVAGPNAFVDSFGWPRVGHTHQGIDMISPAGTPVVAAHPGTVTHSSSSSGGIQAHVYGSNGYSFYAHLSGYSSASGSVNAGTVIGYVGSTGNAGSTNHLHFEWHPGGGSAVNPYQMLLAVC
jgi:murein DD-endopeptidase MepM/ murein hydrolase activator NlpD